MTDISQDIQQQLPVPYRRASIKSPYRRFIQKFGKRKREAEPARHARRAYRNASKVSFSSTILLIVLLFLFLPLVIIAVFSFNEGKAIVWSGFSLKWYAALFLESEKLWHSFANSVLIAFISALISVAIGTFAGLGVQWYRFRGRGYVQAVSILPMVLPEVVIGMSTLIFYYCAYYLLFALCVFTRTCPPRRIRFFDCRGGSRPRRNGAADLIQGDNSGNFSGDFIRLFYVGNTVARRLCDYLFCIRPGFHNAAALCIFDGTVRHFTGDQCTLLYYDFGNYGDCIYLT